MVRPKLSLTDEVEEARYLTATRNTSRYRVITRFFLEQYDQQHFALSFADILTAVRDAKGGNEDAYTEDQCQQDLGELVKFGNLDEDWEEGLIGVQTVDDVLRRNVLYSLTPSGLMIETTVRAMEQMGDQFGKLEGNGMASLYAVFDAVSSALVGDDDQHLLIMWNQFYTLFKQQSELANQYMSDMRRQERERLLDLAAFAVYKQGLVEYLTGFVEGLASYRNRFWSHLQHWDMKAVALRLAATAAASTDRYEDAEHLRIRYTREVTATWDWFSVAGAATRLQHYANRAIEQCLRTAHRLSDTGRNSISRAQDLLRLADAFYRCASAPQAERLAAAAFGLTTPRHWDLEDPGQVSDRADNPTWHSRPLMTTFRGRRAYGPRGATPPVSRGEAARRRALLVARSKQQEQETLRERDALFEKTEVAISDWPMVTSAVHDLVLNWVTDCFANSPSHTIPQPDGYAIRLLNPAESRYVWFVSDEGGLYMPDYRLRLEQPEEENAP